MDRYLRRPLEVAATDEGLDQDSFPDGNPWWESPADDLIHGRERETDSGADASL